MVNDHTMMDEMDAVIFNGPWKIAVEKRPKPKILDPKDAIVKVTTAGICGSELHMYRGHQKTATGHIMVSWTLKRDCHRLILLRAMNSWDRLNR